MTKLNIRTHTWMAANLSWAFVTYNLVNAFDELGHNTYVVSTNGLEEDYFIDKNKMVNSILALQNFGTRKRQIDLDWTYTIPINLPQRFLPNSKHKCVIYNYETRIFPQNWKKYYGYADYFFPSSNFSAQVFVDNGVPKDKVFVIPHGVDPSLMNQDVKPIKLRTKKKYKFLSVVAPHLRKNIPLMLDAFCSAFTNKDDVCLVLKTKVYKRSDGIFHNDTNPGGKKGFEIYIGDVFRDLAKKYGKRMPEIELLSGHVKNMASIYRSCDAHITTTGSEGFGIPSLEAMSQGLLSIGTRYSGLLDFMNDQNSLLIDCKLRKALPAEQYWESHPNDVIGQASKEHTIELMRKAYKEHDQLIEKFGPEMKRTVDFFTWRRAAQMMIDATTGDLAPYINGTYKFPK